MRPLLLGLCSRSLWLCELCSNSRLVPTRGWVGRLAGGQLDWAQHQGQRGALVPAGLAWLCWGS